MRILGWLLFGILAIAVVLLSIANRHPVLLSLDPVNTDAPRLGIEMPLALVVLFSLMVGVLLGGAVSWIGGIRKRRQLARRLKTKAAEDKPSGSRALVKAS